MSEQTVTETQFRPEAYETFRGRRAAALSDLDPTPETVRRLLIWYEYNGVPVPETQEMLLVQAHRERMNASGIDEDKREESRTWLRERGYLPRE